MMNIEEIIGFFKRGDKTPDWEGFNQECRLSDEFGGFKATDSPATHYYVAKSRARALVIALEDFADSEMADEESFDLEAPLYFSESSHRTSPVFFVWQYMQRCRKRYPRSRVSGLILTRSMFINYEDKVDLWKKLGITVIDQLGTMPENLYLRPKYQFECELQRLLNYDIETCSDATLDYAKAVREAENDELDRDFDRLVQEFIDEDEKNADRSAYAKSADSGADDDTSDFGGDTTDGDANSSDGCEGEAVKRDAVTWDSLIPWGDPDFYESSPGCIGDTPIRPSVELLQPMENPEAALDLLVGETEIKEHINKMALLLQYNKKLTEAFPDHHVRPMNCHSIFTGNVGTGKTTMGRIFGSILHKYGFLSKGHTIVASRSSFSGRFYGSEELNVRKIIKVAQGGLLFIDEAYTLINRNDPKDPSNRVIDMFLELLGNEENRDIVVVLAGYAKPMADLLAHNAGIESRFPNRFDFPDFSVDQLLSIGRNLTDREGYSFTESGWNSYVDTVNRLYSNRDPENWGNGREIANLWETMLFAHAERCMNDAVDSTALLEITERDAKMPTPRPQRPKNIGFI